MVTVEYGTSLAVDIYSFGVMMEEVITGEAPDKRRGTVAEARWDTVAPYLICCVYPHLLHLL